MVLPSAELVEDLGNGAGKYVLSQSFEGWKYIIVIPECPDGLDPRTRAYAATETGTIDVRSPTLGYIVLKEFVGLLEAKTALGRCGYRVRD